MGNCLFCLFSVSDGVRQGGWLSPYLFVVYIDDPAVELNCVKTGCFVGNSQLINHIIYTDVYVAFLNLFPFAAHF